MNDHLRFVPHPNPPSLRQPVLHTLGCAVTYSNGVAALLPTTLSFVGGDFVVLLGPSGAGKSTLLRCLNGLVKPTAGKIVSVEHGDICQKASLRAHRRRTGMVFQQHHLIGRQSVLSNVLMGRLGYCSSLGSLMPWATSDKHLALRVLDRVGLLDRALQRADQLSGGQQQRVGIARALAQEPTLLLADEPVASLDPATAERLLGLLRDICKTDGLTAVISLHQVEFAKQFADRIVGLHGGQVVFDGAPTALTQTEVQQIYATTSPRPERIADAHVPPATVTQ
ncbi:MAG: phosphonate ABC transporter ATP-binding protein [Burkholderiales bacterium]